MKRSTKQADVLTAWTSVPKSIRKAIAGLAPEDLELQGGSEGWSVREYVHHLVEANLVASNIVLAALGKPGCTYDWSWVMPDARWMSRLGYDRAPIDPALSLLESLCAHVAGIVRAAPDNLRRHVKLLDAPGARLRKQTVQEVLQGECKHAQHHLRDVGEIRKGNRHSGRGMSVRRRKPKASTA